MEPQDSLGAAAAARQASRPVDARVVSVIRVVLLAAGVWLALQWCYTALPMIRPGADIVLDAKFESLARSVMFLPEDHRRVLVFGNSKAMAGFVPEQFDAALGGQTRSYNLGLPGDARFLPILKATLETGNIPTHVLLTMPWDDKPEPSLLDRLRDDETVLYTVIPFRDLPRDIVTFVAASRLHFRERYQEGERERAHMLDQRGWYFIKGQQFFDNGELPADFAIPTDHPAQYAPRALPAASYALDELDRLARQYGFKVLLVPNNMRSHAAAAPPPADALRSAGVPGHDDMRVLGPDYWVYPPADFSDPVHLNPGGAAKYTHDLAQLVIQTGSMN
jgi:hypothetical protein